MRTILILFVIGFVSGVVAGLLHINYAGSMIQNFFFVLFFITMGLSFIMAAKKIYTKLSKIPS
ncbi:MAG: hypothetical protein IPM42_02760 [Saprospiraceae bacterium]|nr:hypothetical protein [Saprospiraceae bacterium]